MSQKLFTREEVSILQQNPYVVRVSQRTVTFNAKFKQQFYEARVRGCRPVDIIASFGIDPSILGASRINAMDWKIIKQGQMEGGFTPRKNEIIDDNLPPVMSDRARIQQLEAKLAYTRQELEVLKKMLIGSNKKTGK